MWDWLVGWQYWITTGIGKGLGKASCRSGAIVTTMLLYCVKAGIGKALRKVSCWPSPNHPVQSA